jgi:hypothetical protein
LANRDDTATDRRNTRTAANTSFARSGGTAIVVAGSVNAVTSHRYALSQVLVVARR